MHENCRIVSNVLFSVAPASRTRAPPCRPPRSCRPVCRRSSAIIEYGTTIMKWLPAANAALTRAPNKPTLPPPIRRLNRGWRRPGTLRLPPLHIGGHCRVTGRNRCKGVSLIAPQALALLTEQNSCNGRRGIVEMPRKPLLRMPEIEIESRPLSPLVISPFYRSWAKRMVRTPFQLYAAKATSSFI